MDAEIVAWCERVRGCEGVQLMAELHQLARRDRRCEVRMLVYLGEVDERRLFLGEGFSSMFRYATAVLRMSEPQTFLRIQIARLAKKFPVVLEMLAQGALNLSTLKLLDPHLTNDNHVALLDRARNKTKREVELLVAELAPKPDVPSTIRKLPEPAAPRQVRDGQHLLVPEAPASLHAEQAAAVQDTAVRAAPVVAPAQVQRVPVAFALETPRAASTPMPVSSPQPRRYHARTAQLTAASPMRVTLAHSAAPTDPGAASARIANPFPQPDHLSVLRNRIHREMGGTGEDEPWSDGRGRPSTSRRARHNLESAVLARTRAHPS